jgi:hypothetical protein
MSIPTIEHYKVMYADAVHELVGSQERSLLKEFVARQSKQGEIVFLDAIAPDDDARTQAIADTKTRERYEAIDDADIDDWLDLQTPHMQIYRERTAVTPVCIDWGHHFNKENELQLLGDPKSQTLRQAMKRIWKSEDALILGALSAASVTRGKDAANLSTVNLPDTQKLVIDSGAGADGTEDVTSISKDLFAHIKQKFEEKFLFDERIFLVMNPLHKRLLIENSGDKIHNADFVEKRGYFEKGLLPDIYGVHILVHPAVPNNRMYAWNPDGIVWNQWDPLKTNLGVSPEQRFHWVAYMEQYANTVRVDDGLVIQITVQATVGS